MNNNTSRKGNVYWITGLSGAGKTTIGTKLYDYLKTKKNNVIRLDGDIMREIFQNNDYSSEARKALGFQYGRLTRMISNQGIDVVICTIAMFDDIREWNRNNIENYNEIYLEVTIDELRRRNQKGLYTSSTANLSGVSQFAELPKNPDLIIRNYGDITPEIAFKIILNYINGV